MARVPIREQLRRRVQMLVAERDNLDLRHRRRTIALTS
jgi:hypothetical protein